MRAGRDPSGESERLAALLELDLIHGEAFPDLDRLVALANDVCGANLASFTVHDAQRAYQVSSSWGARDTMPKEECLCQVPLAREQTVAISDVRVDRRTAEARYTVSKPFVRSFAGTPVGADPEVPIGILAVGHTEPGKFGQREIERLEKVAELVNAFLAQRREAIRARRAAIRTDDERARQLQFDMVFNAINEGVNVFSADGRIIETNPAAGEILGLTRDEQLGRTIVDPRWRTYRPDGSPFPNSEYPVVQVLNTGQATRNVLMGLELPSGERRWIIINASPVRNAQTDAIEYVVAAIKDVTGQYDSESQVMEQNARLA